MTVGRGTLIEVDARKRLSLGSLANYDRYLANVEEDGTIVLTPAVVLTAAEARLRAAPETAREIDEFLANPESGSPRLRPERRTRRPTSKAG